MEKWVISPLLTEEYINILYENNLLDDLAYCSKPVIVNGVVNYISGDGNEVVKERLKEAYKNRIEFMEVIEDEEIFNTVNIVRKYRFETIHAGLSEETLLEMKKNIISVYNESCDIPYINTISGDTILGIINDLNAKYKVNKDHRYKKLAYLLSYSKELFKDKPNAKAKGTVFKPISKMSMQLDIILKGIEFLLEKKKEGIHPDSWRVF